MTPTLVTPPASDPVSLEEAKDHLRIFFDDDDEYIRALITSATSHLDGHRGVLGRCIMEQTWSVKYPDWNKFLTKAPFIDTTAAVLTYLDETETEQTVDASHYIVFDNGIYFRSSFVRPDLAEDRPDAITLTTTHKMNPLPEALKLAIKVLVAHWYHNRIPVMTIGRGQVPTQTPLTFDALIAPFRVDLT